jgi:hypothetical protein
MHREAIVIQFHFGQPSWSNRWRWIYLSLPWTKRFGHGGWIYLGFDWLKRFWSFDR